MQFKTRLTILQRKIQQDKVKLEKVNRKEEKTKARWTAEYGSFMSAVEDLATVKIHGTKKEKGLQAKVLAWPKRSTSLTKQRDVFRKERDAIKEELIRFGLELARLTEQQGSEIGLTDEIVTQVFSLNDVVVQAAANREECLLRHVFPRLVVDGKLCSQVSFTSSNGMRRVVAMVNTMTIVQGDMAVKAKSEIERFFERFQATAMDANTKALYGLTKQILIEKTSFKVGPDPVSLSRHGTRQGDFSRTEPCAASAAPEHQVGKDELLYSYF
jgi:hypothetical protein